MLVESRDKKRVRSCILSSFNRAVKSNEYTVINLSIKSMIPSLKSIRPWFNYNVV